MATRPAVYRTRGFGDGRQQSYPAHIAVRFQPKRGWHRPCFASGAVYSCNDYDCPYRSACEKAVSPWLPGP